MNRATHLFALAGGLLAAPCFAQVAAPAAARAASLISSAAVAQPMSKIVEAILIQPLQPADEQPEAAAPADAPADAAAPSAPKPAAGAADQHAAYFKALYDSLSPAEQKQMLAYYADMGLNLDEMLGISAKLGEQASKGQQLAQAMRELDFARTPAAVLGARGRLGFGQVAYPNPELMQIPDVAAWIHLQVLAGEWNTLATYLKSRPAPEADAVYAFVLEQLGQRETGMLPEEVLALAHAAPSELKPWQMTTLGKILAQAAGKFSSSTMLAQIRAGTTLFGQGDEAKRRRTVEFLAGGGLVKESYEFLTPIDQALAAQDAPLLLVHARYQRTLAQTMPQGPQAEQLRRSAWELLTQIALLPGASFEKRREALQLAIEGMGDVPRASVSPWLTQVFASDALGPVALELMALQAAKVGDSQQDVEQRAQTILRLKEGVDVLLARQDLDSSALRVPLRMMTTALVQEMEQAITSKGRQRDVAAESQLLLKAVPSERWLSVLEPSLATRARKASIAIATVAEETDAALALVEQAIAASRDEAPAFADHFLQNWEGRLRPKLDVDPEFQFYFWYREYLPMAPLTRGAQRRNLDRLSNLLAQLQAVGVDASKLTNLVPAFRACHATTEVYQRDDIQRVFGSLGAIPPAVAVDLASTMSAGLNGDWRSRDAQRKTGTKRTDSEIAALVDKGYGVALELMDAAVAAEPTEWRYAILRAAIAYDRLQFQQSQGRGGDAEAQTRYRRDAFEAFASAADRYTKAMAEGLERDDPTIYRMWFGAAMGTAELNFIRPEDLPGEGSLQDDQIDLIRKSFDSLPTEARDRHLATFARDMQAAVGRAAPEVKPRLVKQSLRILQDHPAGASLRAMNELYLDLMKNELRLRLSVDGDDRVGVNKPFGVLMSLRYTNSVERETGGFAKYLQNNVWGYTGGSYREVNYRDQLKKNIEESLAKGFTVESIGFFDAFMPGRGVIEDTQDGWVEKPIAYLVLTRKDASVDRLAQITMEMQFNDQTGPVTLALPSNTPALAVGDTFATRPLQDLTISQIVDLRALTPSSGVAKNHPVTLEVRMRGKGILPDVTDVLAGISDALPGFNAGNNAIEAQPQIILQEGALATGRFGWSRSEAEPEGGYPEPDATGMYRLNGERTFIITYTPQGSGAARAFTLPTLTQAATQLPRTKPDDKDFIPLESRTYADLDIVPVTTPVVHIQRSWWRAATLLAIAGVIVLIVAITWLRRRTAQVPALAAAKLAPARMTPLSVLAALRRLESRAGLPADRANELASDIAALEQQAFAPGANPPAESDLQAVISKWSRPA